MQKELNLDKIEWNNVCPPKNLIYRALELTPFYRTKVIILGQDPYHGKNQANGLAFSVDKGEKIPPSLKNIFIELNNDINNFEIPWHGDLTSWTEQGVLLLNRVLTVEENKPGSHYGIGWENYTNNIIEQLNIEHPKVFILWGKKAQEVKSLITNKKHLILESSHPSPLSAYRGFFGSKPFSKTNEFLNYNGLDGIDWKLE